MTLEQLKAKNQKKAKNPTLSATATVEGDEIVIRIPRTLDIGMIRSANTESQTPLVSVVVRKPNSEPGTAYLPILVKEGESEPVEMSGRIGTFNLFL